EIYAPLANRLGIYWIRAELEDLAFRFAYPSEYEQLVSDLAATDRARRKYTTEVEKVLAKLMESHDLPCEVSGRAKNLWGVHTKMRRTLRNVEQIHDLVAFRVITNNIRDCYAVLGVVHEAFTPIPGQFKDYLAMPKPNGYQSLHTAVVGPHGERMEVQIRTQEMHKSAEEGIAAHWIYKEGHSILSPEEKRKFFWLRQLVEFQKELKDPTEFIDAVKYDLFSDEVYVFTPKGDVKALPAGSTPIDFAFSVHTEVGLHCSGARVNGSIVPLRHRLRNGDTVEIITNSSQKPNKDWLKFVVTARARSKIRHFVRAEQRERGRGLGRDLLEREFRKHGRSLSKTQKGTALDEASTKLRCGNKEEDLFMQVGFGKITPLQVVRAVFPELAEQIQQPVAETTKKGRLSQIFDHVRRKAPSSIKVQGEDDVLVRFAHCCNPVPGDNIMGFITRGRGVTIHKLDCSKSLDLTPERRIEVSWDVSSKAEHPVALNVYSLDKPGILAEISKTFSELGVNISRANCRVSEEGRAINTFHFQVSHLDHLKQVMRGIQKIRGIFLVERI
ncbi:MAG: RelA/SpoT family protein, partial [Pseudomonadota bacterium]